MNLSKDELLALVRKGARNMSWQEKLRLTVLLSLPAMVAQISSVAMQIIDAAMLGHLGTKESAAVGLVSTTIWLFGGLCSAFAAGFSVQVAHYVGAEDLRGARNIIRQGLFSGLVFSLLLALIGLFIAPHLPVWLGADKEIHAGASEYFSIVAAALPVLEINMLAAGSLRCSGNIKIPSFLNALMCVLDVIFNYLFIFVFHMGTAGAAYGTFLAYAITMSLMIYFMTAKDQQLRFSLDTELMGKWNFTRYIPNKNTMKRAFTIGSPISLERGVMCGAQIAITGIIAPLGSVAIAANTFGINIESVCYMPGYGISEAATTLVGQSLGAKRKDLMRSFAWISVCLGMAIMALMGILMAVFAPEMMQMVTTDNGVVELGAEVLRIEAWAEPMFAASIVAYGAFVGSGKTLVPSLMNLGSIWIVRLTLALLLAPSMGLQGVWIAMCIELCWRGAAFLFRLRGRSWSNISMEEAKRPTTQKEKEDLIITDTIYENY
ncbi:MAG: MATE family efflux transporter [Prevotellaceae bacterium]|jgi:putative MATE family efflux protein|nr:MATE family efflux transporter [Bacteroidaceae bacterium]MCI6802417.1 MATE family efflux transporter [Prevotellaceae bacterium]MDD6015195.1 MATE family efflux transporter [Prevotellaceae bacterium]